MTDLLLCEAVFLLGHDEESGKSELSANTTSALPAALLLDLALNDLVRVEEKDKLALTGTQAGHPLLRRAVEVVAAEEKPRSVQQWLTRLPAGLKPFGEAVGGSLVDRGVLAEEKAKRLGLFTTTRWPEQDPEPERRLRDRLAEVLVRGAEPGPYELSLVALLHTYSLTGAVVDKDDRKAARKTAGALTERARQGDAVAKSIGKAVQAAQAAIIASMAATTAATTATVVNS